MTHQALEFLQACLLARLNLVISGPSEGGNTKLLQALASFLPDEDPTLVIQNPDEATLKRKGITSLRASLSPDQEKGVITRAYLLTLVPKMHPQRLLLDGVQGPEALPLLKLLFTMDGVIFSIVADSPADAFSNLERMLLLSEVGLRMDMTRRVLASSLDLIIQSQAVKDGITKVVNLAEVADVEDDIIVLRDIFLLQEADDGEIESLGSLCPTGITPQFLDRMKLLGISLPAGVFMSPGKENGPPHDPRPT